MGGTTSSATLDFARPRKVTGSDGKLVLRLLLPPSWSVLLFPSCCRKVITRENCTVTFTLTSPTNTVLPVIGLN